MEESYDVPLQSDKVTVVVSQGDTLAITDIPLTIKVPTNVPTRSEHLEVTFVDYSKLPAFERGSYIAANYYLLLFEDSFNADYDYNDFVAQVAFEMRGNKYNRRLALWVRGFALGSSKTLGFGFTDANGDNYMLSDDVRLDYFSNQQGFLNTESGKKFVPGIESVAGKASEERDGKNYVYSNVHGKMSGGGYVAYYKKLKPNISHGNKWNSLSFFITVEDGKKIYIASIDQELGNRCPYGLALHKYSGEVSYPIEKTYMQNAYPLFDNWINGEVKDWTSEINKSACYTINEDYLFAL